MTGHEKTLSAMSDQRKGEHKKIKNHSLSVLRVRQQALT